MKYNLTEARVITWGGSQVPSCPTNGVFYTLKELEKIVGGFVEIIPLSEDRILICNRKGQLLGEPFNPFATSEFRMETNINNFGTVLVCPRSYIQEP